MCRRGEIAVAQDSYNRRSDRARSSFDRPHRLAGNFVYELPYFRDQKGVTGVLLGGWQLNSQFSLQSGSPFTPLNGSDPAGALASISALVGNAIRPNLNTTLDFSSMSVEDIARRRTLLYAERIHTHRYSFAYLRFVGELHPCDIRFGFL